MRVLIIGGTGLISTSITKQLLARGDEVVLFNRGKTKVRVPEGATIMHGDRNEFAAFEASMADQTFDAVIDMVAFGPAQIESALRAFTGRAGHYVFCSTVDVYTKPAPNLPVTEHTSRHAPSDYGVNKAACEDVLFGSTGLPFTIIRPAHTYGEGGTMIHTFGWTNQTWKRVREGKPIVVHGDGSAAWASCHIDDVANAFVNSLGNPKAMGKAYHTTGDQCVPWDTYHQEVAAAMGAPTPTIVHIPTDVLCNWAPDKMEVTRLNFQYSNIFDNNAAHQDLGFVQTISLRDGARRTIAWLDANGMIDGAVEEPFYDEVLARWDRAMSVE